MRTWCKMGLCVNFDSIFSPQSLLFVTCIVHTKLGKFFLPLLILSWSVYSMCLGRTCALAPVVWLMCYSGQEAVLCSVLCLHTQWGLSSLSCQYPGLWDDIVQMLLPDQEVSLPEEITALIYHPYMCHYVWCAWPILVGVLYYSTK